MGFEDRTQVTQGGYIQGFVDQDAGLSIADELLSDLPRTDDRPRNMGEVLAKHLPSVMTEALVKRDKDFSNWQDLLEFFNVIGASLKERLLKAIEKKSSYESQLAISKQLNQVAV